MSVNSQLGSDWCRSQTNRSKMKVLTLTVVLILVGGHEAARILALFPTPSKSHWILQEPYLKGLHARGHDITVVTAFDETPPTANWTTVPIPNLIHVIFGNTSRPYNMGKASPFLITPFIFWGTGKLCDEYFGNENMKKLYNSNEKYDLLIIPTFWNECLLAFSYKFNLPAVAFSTSNALGWVNDIVGNPNSMAYIPDLQMEYNDHMNFWQRLRNVVFQLYAKSIRYFYSMPNQWSIVQKHINDPAMPSLRELERKYMSLLLVNDHVSIGYPRPLVPNLIEVGGIHLKPAKKLPQDLQKFLDNAKDGVIYFSLGSNLKSSEMPEEKRQAFLKVFSRLKQQVLWKWEQETLPGQPQNVKLSKWLPQNDILAHKNVKLFITHGGLLSTEEAIYHGVPLVSIPVFGDQSSNAFKTEQFGYGRRVEFANVTEESLYWAISEVLNNPSYAVTARRLSQLFNDRRRSPLEEALYWTEYVLRHDGARHMRTAALDLAWYQYLLLDVLGFLVAVVSLVLLVLGTVLRLVIRRLTGKPQDKSKKQ